MEGHSSHLGSNRDIACSYVTPCIDLVAASGLDLPAFFKDTDVPLSRLRDPNQYVSWDELCDFLDLAAEHLDRQKFIQIGVDSTLMNEPGMKLIRVVSRLVLSVPGTYPMGIWQREERLRSELPLASDLGDRAGPP
jgi:hypothetical protein